MFIFINCYEFVSLYRIALNKCLLLSYHNKSKNTKNGKWDLQYIQMYMLSFYLFIHWGFKLLSTLSGHITTGSWKGRGNQYIQLVKILYCNLPTNGKQLAAFSLKVRPGSELLSQRWEARVLPLCHRGPMLSF